MHEMAPSVVLDAGSKGCSDFFVWVVVTHCILSAVARPGLSNQVALFPQGRIIFYRWNVCIKSGPITGEFSL